MLENLVKTFRRRTADESAASAIELAIVLPILLLAALALVDMAFFVANWTGTNAGATSAARTIVVTPAATQDDLKAAVLSDAPQLGASDFEVNVAWGEEKTQEYTHHFPDKTATKFVTKKRNVVTQDVTVTVTAKRPYLTVLGKAWGQSAGTGDDMVAKSSCTMSVDRTNGTNWVGEDNYIPGIRWTLVDGVLTVMPEEGYSWGVGINDGVVAANSKLSDWVTLTDDEWKTVTEVNFEGSVAFGDSKGNRYCPRIYRTKATATLIKADLSAWDSSKVTDMSDMFYNCETLASLDVSNWDTSSFTNMKSIFSNCTSLTSLDVSNWDTSSFTNMEDMFVACWSLASLDVSNWDTSKVTDMNAMFYGCHMLTSLDVSNWDTSKVTDMSFMFYDCWNLTTIYAGNGWTVAALDNASAWRGNAGYRMFLSCGKLVGAVSYDYSKTDASMANWETGYLTYKGTELYDSIDASGADLSKLSKVVGVYPCDESGKEIKTLQFSGTGESNAKTVYYAWEFQFSDGSTKRYAMWKLSESEQYSLLISQSGNWYIYADNSNSGQGNNCCWKDADDGKATLWLSDSATEVPSQISFSWTAENFRGTAYSGNANPYVSIPIKLKE